ncbi:MAG: hypothetical protein V4572_13455 [Bacteroidota bacterium]
MIRKLLYLVLLSSIYVNAQTTIIEDKDNGTYRYTKATLLSNSNFVKYGRNFYDENGIPKPWIDSNTKLGFTAVSSSEDAFTYFDDSEGLFKLKMGYIVNGKLILVKSSDMKEDNFSPYDKSLPFTSKNIYFLSNQKGKTDINFMKDDLYLSVKDILTRKLVTYKIEKPNLDKYIGPNFIKPKEEFRFKLVVNYDKTVDLVSKSISKDYTNTILYKTRFSDEGKKVKELVCDLKISNHVFLYSRNGAGKFTDGGYDNKFLHFGDDLSINNYIEDFKTGDVYIYGLYGDELGKLNDMANPKGFYIFKFDKSGNKVWESINKINDSGFNSNLVMVQVFVDLVQLNDNVCFSIRTGGLKDFFHYSIVDKTSGKMIKTQNVEFNESFAHANNIGDMEYGINTSFKGLSKAKFDFNGIIAINSNSKVADYIRNTKSKNNLFFSAQFSDKGIWLYEACEKEYFKVTLFKD